MNAGPDQQQPTLTFGVVEGGGPVDAALTATFRELAAFVRRNPGGRIVGDEAGVNVQFHIGGPIWPLDFEGIRTTRFNRAEAVQIVQVAVPDEPVSDKAQAREYVATSLVAAVETATDRLRSTHAHLSTQAATRAAETAARYLRERSDQSPMRA